MNRYRLSPAAKSNHKIEEEKHMTKKMLLMHPTNLAWRKMIWLAVAVTATAWGQTLHSGRRGVVPNEIGSFAQLAVGGGQWTTTFTVVNTGTAVADITLNFYNNDGSPLTLTLNLPQSNSSQTVASFTDTLSPDQGVIIQTVPFGTIGNAPTTGWADLSSDGTVNGFAVFTDSVSAVQEQQAAVPLDTRDDPGYLLFFDNTNGFSTGVAVANQDVGTQATVVAVIRDDTGNMITTQQIPLAAGGHTSFVLSSMFTQTANIRGTVEFDAPSGGQIVVLGLAFNPENAFTSIPTLSLATATGVADVRPAKVPALNQ
jgi:hypothetical protein